jgi:osmotically inducible lipoprotein OsmB
MNARRIAAPALAAALLMSILGGCQNLPGTDEQQGAVAGGAIGAVLGSAIAENEVFGALLGGALGAGGGYLIGANYEKLTGQDDDREDAREAVAEASRDPATVADVDNSSTADLNGDGFVTMDELVAMDQAGLSDAEMIERLEATGQVFVLNDEQQDRLIEAGVSAEVVAAMETINQDQRARLLEQRNDVISRDPQS